MNIGLSCRRVAPVRAGARAAPRTVWARLLCFGILGLIAGCDPAPSPNPSPSPSPPLTGPNVVFILADALRADRLDASRGGVPLMPGLRAFAAESWRFDRARVQATWTKPSMASIFTSLYPGVHQVLFGIHDTIYEGQPKASDKLPDSLETMASYLKSHGYSTAGVQTNANVSAVFGFDQGFDTYFFEKYPDYRGNQVTDQAIRLIEEMSSPFFLYAHYMDTHAPYDPPSPQRDAFGPAPELTPEDRKLLDNYVESYIDRVLFEVGLTRARKFTDLSKAGEEHVGRMYDGEALFLDTEVARLIAYIRANVPNTIIVFTADHGEELWDHGSIGHGKTVYEELTHVPLVIHAPGRTPRVIPAPVESIDILPTIAGLLGLEQRPWWQGRDLALLLDVLPGEHPVYSSTQMSIPGSNVDLECVVAGHLKLIVDLKEANRGGLYDLSRDPKELGPPIVSPATIQGLERLLTDRRAFNQAHPKFQATPARVGLDEETAEALRAQGYAVGSESNADKPQ